jgi:hypothetical protein
VAQFYGRYKLSMIDEENAAMIWNVLSLMASSAEKPAWLAFLA